MEEQTFCTSFTPYHAEYNTRLNFNINNTTVDMHMHPEILSFNLDPKLTYNKQIDNAAANVLQYASTVWTPIASTIKHNTTHCDCLHTTSE